MSASFLNSFGFGSFACFSWFSHVSTKELLAVPLDLPQRNLVYWGHILDVLGKENALRTPKNKAAAALAYRSDARDL
jgi:hypothetical protein